MIKLKVFISSVQKELREERIAIGSFLSTDDFLRECTVPRIFEDYPQPLRPNPKAYLDLLRQCQIYLLLIGKEYGSDAGDGLSATHEEYRLAQDLKLPTLVCVKGERKTKRDDAVTAFLSVERLASGEARSRSRNPLVVQGLSWLELMDERGSGIRRMTRVLEEVGHPRPVFAIDHDSLVVEFFPVPGEIDKPGRTPRKGVKADLSPNDRILLEVEQSGSVSTKICVQRLGIPRATAQRILVQMVDEGKLEIIGAGPTTRYRLITEAS